MAVIGARGALVPIVLERDEGAGLGSIDDGQTAIAHRRNGTRLDAAQRWRA
jgi:hypothetical protein